MYIGTLLYSMYIASEVVGISQITVFTKFSISPADDYWAMWQGNEQVTWPVPEKESQLQRRCFHRWTQSRYDVSRAPCYTGYIIRAICLPALCNIAWRHNMLHMQLSGTTENRDLTPVIATQICTSILTNMFLFSRFCYCVWFVISTRQEKREHWERWQQWWKSIHGKRISTVGPRFTGPRFTGTPIYREDKLPPI